MLFCPECGTKNEETAMFCGNCGLNLDKVELSTTDTSSPAASEEQSNSVSTMPEPKTSMISQSQQICDRCENPVDSDTAFCGHCGSPVKQSETGSSASPSPRPQQPICPNCETPQSDASAFCGNCGYQLNDQSNLKQHTHSQSTDQSGMKPPASRSQAQSTDQQREQQIRAHPDRKDPYTALFVSFIIPGFAYMWIKEWDWGIGFFLATIIFLQFVPSLVIIGIILYIAQLYKGFKRINEYNDTLIPERNREPVPNSSYQG